MEQPVVFASVNGTGAAPSHVRSRIHTPERSVRRSLGPLVARCARQNTAMSIQDEHGWLAFCPLLRIGKGREMGGSFQATTRFIGTLMMSSTSSVLDLIQTRIRTSRRDHEPTADRTDYHPFLPAVLDDPYPFYRRLLAAGRYTTTSVTIFGSSAVTKTSAPRCGPTMCCHQRTAWCGSG